MASRTFLLVLAATAAISSSLAWACPFAEGGGEGGPLRSDTCGGTARHLLQQTCPTPYMGTFSPVADFGGTLLTTMSGYDIATSSASCQDACKRRCDCMGYKWNKGGILQYLFPASCDLMGGVASTPSYTTTASLSYWKRDVYTCPVTAGFSTPGAPVPGCTVDCGTRICWQGAMRKEMDAIDNENAAAGKGAIIADILRLSFHDCGPGICDASIILDRVEWDAPQNARLEGIEAVRRMKDKASATCGKTPSFADTILLSTTIAIEKAQGPSLWQWLPLGRADWTYSADNLKKNNPARLPGSRESTDALLAKFGDMFNPLGGDPTAALVALSGAHTVGEARCNTFNPERKNPPNPYSDRFIQSDNRECQLDCLLKAFDMDTPEIFDNNYYKLVQKSEGLLISDQGMYGTPCTKVLVDQYAGDQKAFFEAFGKYFLMMSIMGNPGLYRPTAPCTVPPPTPPVVDPYVCFPADATVLLRDGSTKTMENLLVGDNVATVASNGDLTFEPVYFFGHRAPSKLATYLQIHVSPLHSNSTIKVLDISHLHFIHTDEPSSHAKFSRRRTVRASDLNFGSTLWLAEDGKAVPGRVRKINVVQKLGLFNPYTLGGDIVVNGVLASSHSDWVLDGLVPAKWDHHLPSVYQKIFSPLRAFYHVFGPSAMEGVHQKLASSKSGSALRMVRDVLEWNVESS